MTDQLTHKEVERCAKACEERADEINKLAEHIRISLDMERYNYWLNEWKIENGLEPRRLLMIDHEKLVKALGWPGAGEHHYWIDVNCIPKEHTDRAERDWGLVYDAGYGEDDNGQAIVASYHSGWWIDCGDFQGLVENGDLLLAHLVEEKVRELCPERWKVRYEFNRETNFETLKECEVHYIQIYYLEDTSAGWREWRLQYEVVELTKFAAYAAALVWLAERKG